MKSIQNFATFRRSIVAAAMLAAIAGVVNPAVAGCKRWEFNSQTFDIVQANGYTVKVTFGPAQDVGDSIHFGQGQAQFRSDGKWNFGFTRNAGFSRITGYLQFEIAWNPDVDARYISSTVGFYSGNIISVRDGARNMQIGDLTGWTAGTTTGRRSPFGGQLPDEHGGARWNSKDRVFCKAENTYHGVAPPLDPAPIRRSGRMPSNAEAKPQLPPDASLSKWLGDWSTRTSQGGRFTLTFTGNGNELTGMFKNDDGNVRFNGMLTGTVVGNTLRYKYVQPVLPGGGGSGTGVFGMSADGRKIDGDAVAETPSRTSIRWSGDKR